MLVGYKSVDGKVDGDTTGIFHVFELQIGMNEFEVCSLYRGLRSSNACKTTLFPDQVHRESVVPKLEMFWRVCILSEVLGR